MRMRPRTADPGICTSCHGRPGMHEILARAGMAEHGAPRALIGVSEIRRPTPNLQICAGAGLCRRARVGVHIGGSARALRAPRALLSLMQRSG